MDFESNLYANYLISHFYKFQPMYKFKIPNSWKDEISRDLNRMNINYSTLFPGVEEHFKSLVNEFNLSATD